VHTERCTVLSQALKTQGTASARGCLRTSDALLLSMMLLAGILCTLSNNYIILAHGTILYIISTEISLSYNKISIRLY